MDRDEDKNINEEAAAEENTAAAEEETASTPETENAGIAEEKKKNSWKIFGGKDKKEEKKEQTPEERINELTEKLAEAEKLRLLALAEMDNQRKRAAKERENMRLNITQDTVMPFLQVFDFFTMAVKSAQQSQNLDALLQGMQMIQQLFDKALDELGVEKIEAVGKKFDPALHDAKEQRPSDTVPEGIVIEQWNTGFKFGDRLMKPAMVIVSSGKEKTEPAAEQETEG